MTRPKKTKQVDKVYSLAEEVSNRLKDGKSVVVVCRDLPNNNSGKLVINKEYIVNETTTFCKQNYLSVLTDVGCFWYHESRFELLEENK